MIVDDAICRFCGTSDTFMYEAGLLGQHQISLEEIPDLELFQLLDFLRRLGLDD